MREPAEPGAEADAVDPAEQGEQEATDARGEYDATPRPRRHRRVRTRAVEGSDPTPQATQRMLDQAIERAAEDTELAWGDAPVTGGGRPGGATRPGGSAGPGGSGPGSPGTGGRPDVGPNDERLRRDKPPHWG